MPAALKKFVVDAFMELLPRFLDRVSTDAILPAEPGEEVGSSPGSDYFSDGGLGSLATGLSEASGPYNSHLTEVESAGYILFSQP